MKENKCTQVYIDFSYGKDGITIRMQGGWIVLVMMENYFKLEKNKNAALPNSTHKTRLQISNLNVKDETFKLIDANVKRMSLWSMVGKGLFKQTPMHTHKQLKKRILIISNARIFVHQRPIMDRGDKTDDWLGGSLQHLKLMNCYLTVKLTRRLELPTDMGKGSSRQIIEEEKRKNAKD